MAKKWAQPGARLAKLVRSPLFFWIVLALFVLQAAWIALSSRYPMAFDEGTHLGLIQIFSHQWSPRVLHQPDGPAVFGTVVHNPSYLYYALMSWPYRLLAPHFDLQMTVILLRFLNIAFFAGGLLLFRKVLLRTKVSPSIIHIALLFFTLVPIATLQAGQISYDNLLFLLLGWNLLQVLRFREQLLHKKTCNVPLLLTTLSVGMLASLTMFSYLPIFVAITLYLAALLWRQRKIARKLWRKNWAAAHGIKKYGALILLIVSLGVFVEMYGTNLVRYHNITPQCGQVLGVERCLAYGPWARNYDYSLHPRAETNHNPLIYTGGWLVGMMQRSFFVINGPSGPEPYANKPPLPGILVVATVVFGLGIVLLAWRWRQVGSADSVLQILLFVCAAYSIALWGKLYYDYVRLDRLVAVNGRYLLLIILPMLVAIGSAYQQVLKHKTQMWLLGATFLLFLQGGGFVSFLYFSDKNWYWQNDRTIISINERAHAIVHPLVVNWPTK